MIQNSNNKNLLEDLQHQASILEQVRLCSNRKDWCLCWSKSGR